MRKPPSVHPAGLAQRPMITRVSTGAALYSAASAWYLFPIVASASAA